MEAEGATVIEPSEEFATALKEAQAPYDALAEELYPGISVYRDKIKEIAAEFNS